MLKKILCLVGLLLPALSYAETIIPEAIKVPEGNQLLLTAHAQGVQIYSCTLDNDKYEWQLQAPDARLFDDKGQIIGKHYSGPIWEYKEGSRVVGKLIKKIPSPSPSAISWLLVEVTGHKGEGFLSKVSFINRINTRGGLPPTADCNGNTLGSEKRSAYTADYIFYTRP